MICMMDVSLSPLPPNWSVLSKYVRGSKVSIARFCVGTFMVMTRVCGLSRIAQEKRRDRYVKERDSLVCLTCPPPRQKWRFGLDMMPKQKNRRSMSR